MLSLHTIPLHQLTVRNKVKIWAREYEEGSTSLSQEAEVAARAPLTPCQLVFGYIPTLDGEATTHIYS